MEIGIKDADRLAVADLLAKLLADEFVLYTKTRNAHWNVQGPDFYDKHKFFESQYEQLDDIMDEVAERIRMLGHYASATLEKFLQLTHLTEWKKEPNTGLGFIKQLTEDHESVIVYIRAIIPTVNDDHGDTGTADFLTAKMEQHEKMAWFLRSHFE